MVTKQHLFFFFQVNSRARSLTTLDFYISTTKLFYLKTLSNKKYFFVQILHKDYLKCILKLKIDLMMFLRFFSIT
jgi:hypothetical protein